MAVGGWLLPSTHLVRAQQLTWQHFVSPLYVAQRNWSSLHHRLKCESHKCQITNSINHKSDPQINVRFRQSSLLRFLHTTRQPLKDYTVKSSKVADQDEELDDKEPTSVWEQSDMYQDQYLYPSQGHRVIIIHPVIRGIKQTAGVEPEDQMAESCALIDALPGWIVVQKEMINVRQVDASRLFTKGVYENVKSIVQGCRSKSAVFVNVGMLAGIQLSMLQKSWNVPVYDRYTIILQIFRLRSHTMEAKLQLALAEIPYYRSRLKGMHDGSLSPQQGGLEFTGGTGETVMEARRRIMADKEQAIRKKLSALKSQRELLRKERKKKELPLVAVVGYTNAGKTSLIKALTSSSNLEPWDQVFATLDVTCHAGYLGNHMKVVYIDSVGFISDIPTSLIQSFSATLEDTANADVIVHVRDASHPDTEAQKQTVINTLRGLKLNNNLIDSIIEVNNKIDRIPRFVVDMLDHHPVSTVTGEGLPQLIQSLEDAVIISTGRVNKTMKIPQAGEHLTWLYKEATVSDCRPCDTDSESLLVDVVMTAAAYEKFSARFSNKKRRLHGKR